MGSARVVDHGNNWLRSFIIITEVSESSNTASTFSHRTRLVKMIKKQSKTEWNKHAFSLAVDSCDPPLAQMDHLEHRLQETNNLAAFLANVRKEFVSLYNTTAWVHTESNAQLSPVHRVLIRYNTVTSWDSSVANNGRGILL